MILDHFLYTTTTHIGMDDSGSGEPQSGKAAAHVTLKHNQMIVIEAILSHTHQI